MNNLHIKEAKHNYGVDLLRIAAMLMIVMHHFSLHSGIELEPFSNQETLNNVMALFGKTGVNIFVLITGYYAGGKIRRDKILKLMCLTAFYSISLTFIACVVGSVAFSRKLILKSVLPFLFGGNYWFITTYLELYIVAPILNKVIESIPKQTYQKYMLCFTVLLCILPSVVGKFIGTNDFGYTSLTWFIYLYFLGAYLHKYGLPIKHGIFTYVWIGLMVLQIAACILISEGRATGITRQVLACITDYSANAVFPLAIAVAMLLSFENLVIRSGKELFRIMGSATLGVYLFHDNMNLRGWMWENVYQFVSRNGMNSFAISAVLSVLVVFLVGCVVEITRGFVIKFIGRKIAKRQEQPCSVRF